MYRLVAALMAGSLILSACAHDDALASEDVPSGAVDATMRIERPTRTEIPYDQTPEAEMANEPCPQDLQVDTIAPVGDPGVDLKLVAYAPDASALAFAPDGRAFIGSRGGSIFKWAPRTEPTMAAISRWGPMETCSSLSETGAHREVRSSLVTRRLMRSGRFFDLSSRSTRRRR